MYFNNNKQLIRQCVANFFKEGKIAIELERCKNLRPIIEKLITKCKHGKGVMPNNQIQKIKYYATHPDLLDKIFKISEKYKDRQGGYTRILKLGERKGDGAKIGAIRLV